MLLRAVYIILRSSINSACTLQSNITEMYRVLLCAVFHWETVATDETGSAEFVVFGEVLH